MWGLPQPIKSHTIIFEKVWKQTSHRKKLRGQVFYPLAHHPPDPALQPAAEVPPRPPPGTCGSLGSLMSQVSFMPGSGSGRRLPLFYAVGAAPGRGFPAGPTGGAAAAPPPRRAGSALPSALQAGSAALTWRWEGAQRVLLESSPYTRGLWPLQIRIESGRLIWQYPVSAARSCGWRTGGEPVPMTLTYGAKRGSELPSGWEAPGWSRRDFTNKLVLTFRCKLIKCS